MGDYAALLKAQTERQQQQQKPTPSSPVSSPTPEVGKEEVRKVGFEEKRKIGNPTKRKVGKEEKRVAGKEEKRKSSALFAINDPADRKDSFFFTDAEFRAIKRFVVELEEIIDTKITKTDLARCAFQMLLDDYRAHGEKGRVVQYLKGKHSRK
jgi:hypothetical protein